MSKKHTLEDVKVIAEKNRGWCLSNEYIDNKGKLEWLCQNGHKWEAPLMNIKMGYWCPYCNASVAESICRCYFEKLFGKDFIKCRPYWLISSKGYKMELDGYCEEFNIAFEYQGEQHYGKHALLSGNADVDGNIVGRDRLKKELCFKECVVLIVIPYHVDYDVMGKFIVEECKKNNIDICNNLDSVDYRNFDIYKYNNRLDRCHVKAKDNGGKCLSNIYINACTKMKWMCSDGHVWEANSDNILRNGRWCPKCAAKNRGDILKINMEDIIFLAKNNNGKCLDDGFNVGEDLKNKELRWMCNNGHVWSNTYKNIKYKKTWCKICKKDVKKDFKLKELVDFSKSKGGKCLSKAYVNAKTKMMWKCDKDHIWEATSNNILRNRWCPKCAVEKRRKNEVRFK